MNPIDYAKAHVAALTGHADTAVHWRAIHDKDKGAEPRVMFGSVDECFLTLSALNIEGFGIFCVVNGLDGNGYSLPNVTYIRAHLVDLDDPYTARQMLEQASNGGATFGVQSSPEKYHAYWTVNPYTGVDVYQELQRKLVQVYGGDKKVIDATRVMRVPGFYHMKADPFMVTCFSLSGQRYDIAQLQANYAAVNVINTISTRHELGHPEMQAPTLEWLKFALHLIDPNTLQYDDWVAVTAAFKQAGWNLTDEATLETIWSNWCDKYEKNDRGENTKKWRSIRDSQVGWSKFKSITTVNAYMLWGDKVPELKKPAPPAPPVQSDNAVVATPSNSEQSILDNMGEIIDADECKLWFKGCYFVESSGKIFTPSGRFMGSSQFNGAYGGKVFIISSTGKTCDEASKAALRSTVYTIPKVDHIRFLPEYKRGEIIIDSLGRKGLNTYIPARIKRKAGDVTPWLEWLAKALPNERDRTLLLEYMAHCVKFPGYKIPWAPLLQSAEGIGKTIFFEIMSHCMGDMYVYKPKAPELVKSGSTFNSWQRNKLMILVDEIRIDERLELIEILKPMITDARVEIQSKGVDQDMEDNVANWIFFSNYKNAVPINQNGRRYAIFYSALQTARDIEAMGMGGDYFPHLFAWLRNEGLPAIADYLLTYPIERGALPSRAPKTSSYNEALLVSRSPMENIIADSVTDELTGFRGGYISTLAVAARCKANGMRVSVQSIRACLENMEYVSLGRSLKTYFQEDPNIRSEIYANSGALPLDKYGVAQGYE